MPAPAIAPASWATTYGAMSFAGMRPAVNRPIVTAGLKCPPETWPTAEAIVNTERPKANETPSSPMPTCGNAAASTALPQPPKTSQSVPRNSADNLCVKLNSFMLHLFRVSSRDISPIVSMESVPSALADGSGTQVASLIPPAHAGGTDFGDLTRSGSYLA